MNLKPKKKETTMSYEEFSSKVETTIQPMVDYWANDKEGSLYPGHKKVGVRGNDDDHTVQLILDEPVIEFNYSDENAVVATLIEEDVTMTLNEEDSKQIMEYFVNPAIADMKESNDEGCPKKEIIKALAAACAALVVAKAAKKGTSPMEEVLAGLFKD